MNPTFRKQVPEMTAILHSSAHRWVYVSLTGAILGILAQFLRQVPGALMYLGASTAPWVMVGFLFAVSASRGVPTPRKAILVATGTIAAYLLAWLVSYHLLFVLRESVSLAAGWRQAAPWIVAAVPASPILGTIAALSHKRGILGDVCLAVPIAWSLPESLKSLTEGWLVGTAVITPVALFAAMLIHMAINERRVRAITLLATVVTLGALGIALFPVVWYLFLGRF
ncbi:hypothetical protein KZ483_13225 [Paenibacillus sp. sptzw28]|uniref:DUF6518 family protein n=1 Tax=Paenibacillus sp. sptzw28 TaxID=715179 RepID=UPI001C6EA8DC|nr:DUF6518 family protein [Paenibacillus sp. sptzw28]QYR23762.1 hypothetical protein KZ483_13225 [Paenibacillus sp. sptzw28]